MSRLALAFALAVLLCACGDSTTQDTDDSSGSTTEAITGGPVCGDGHVDPGEECDGGDNCDAWCLPAAYIFALPVHPSDMSTVVSAGLQCTSYAKNTGPYREYLPYLGEDPGAMMKPLAPPQGYSQMCEVSIATPSKASALADIPQLQVDDLCEATSDLSQYSDIWVDTCAAGTGKVRDKNGVKDIDCTTPDYQAVLLCVGQPL